VAARRRRLDPRRAHRRHAAEPWLAALRRHSDRAAEPDGRRLGVARRLAVLLDRYARHRPEMVLAWAAGELVDDDGGELPADLVWQAHLWGLLAERLHDVPHPAARTEAAVQRLRDEPDLLDLPDALSLFGITRLPAADLRVVRAIAERRDVALLLLHPSPALWERLAAHGPSAPARGRPHAHRPEPPAARLVGPRRPRAAAAPRRRRGVRHHPAALAGATLLERLQREIQADAPPRDPSRRRPATAASRSTPATAAPGRSRCCATASSGLMADDPTLEPRDVLVMCPDIEDFAPLISATFGAIEGDDDRPDLRVRLADRSVRQTNPVLGAVSALLDLVAGRTAASAVLDLADREPVRRRFGFDDDDLGPAGALGRRHGRALGDRGRHRAPFSSTSCPTAPGARAGPRAPRRGGGRGGPPPVAGHAAARRRRLGRHRPRRALRRARRPPRRARDALTVPQPMPAWARAIAGAADALTATSPSDAWQRAELHRILDDLVRDAGDVALPSRPRRSATSSPTGWPAARPARTSARAP
jgi:exodeoxyribonuclease V gamma subunit